MLPFRLPQGAPGVASLGPTSARAAASAGSEQPRSSQDAPICLLEAMGVGHWLAQVPGYHAWNMALCQEATSRILKLTKHQMKKMNKQISEGLLQPERSLKETQRQKSSRPALQHADALLAWLHQNVAEDLAEGVRVDGECEAAKKKRIAADPLPKLASIPFLDRLEEEEQGVRWMPPGTTLAEMHDLSMSFLPDTRVSYSTFIGCYHLRWAKRLKIRNEGQHSKCSLCERFKAYRKQCSAPADSKKVSEEYASHLEAVMQDRAADQRLCAAAQLAAGSLTGVPSSENSLLSITIDAMDAAKFRCPRNIGASKEFQNLWRPELSLIGAITEGLRECYYLCDPDLSKNADLHITIIGHSLQLAKESFQARGKPFPRHLRLHTDNAASEGKNQTVFFLAAWLVKRKLFDSVLLTQFRVGHTHSKIDQRFSELRSALSQSTVLEDPSAFAEAIRSGVKPRESRELAVHHLHAAPDFKSFFQHLELRVSGHAQTKFQKQRNEEAIHAFGFALRGSTSGGPTLPSADPDAEDVILTCQQYLSSHEPCQEPAVFARATDFEKLPPNGPSQLSARLSLSQRQHREFQKTAEAISREPWSMHAGCAFLLQFLEENANNTSEQWVPLPTQWMLQGTRAEVDATRDETVGRALAENAFSWNHAKPAPVQVARPPQKLRRLQVKQPALLRQPTIGDESRGASSSEAAAVPEQGQTLSHPEAEPSTPELPPPAGPLDGGPLLPAASRVSDPGAEHGRDTMGAPAALYGRGGAPPRVAAPGSRPAAKPAAKAEAGAKAKGKAKAKAASKAAAAKPSAKARAQALGSEAPAARPPRRHLGRLPMPAGAAALLGCTRCRYSASGCQQCRKKAGIQLNQDETAWIWRPAD